MDMYAHQYGQQTFLFSQGYYLAIKEVVVFIEEEAINDRQRYCRKPLIDHDLKYRFH